MSSKYRPGPLLLTTVLLAALILASAAVAQDEIKPADQLQAASKLTVGDPAPALKVEKFVKGETVEEFKAGHVYVVEFWATWCGPCKVTMPHLTELQKKWTDKVTFIGVNIWEDRKGYTDKTLTKVEEFVKANSEKMGYTVAFDGAAKKTDKAYMGAAGQNGIPTAFVISPDARIAFIGHPQDPGFEGAIEKLVEGKFDMKAAAAEYKEQVAREEAQEKLYRQAMKLMNEGGEFINEDKIEEGLAKIDEAAKLMPNADPTQTELQKFSILLSAKKYERAYAVAAKLLEGPAADEPGYLNMIAWSIVDPDADIEKRDADLAFKAAEKAVKLTEEKDAAILDTLARCCWLKGEKAKAIEIQKKAVELCKNDPEARESLQKTLDEYKQ